MPYYFAKSNFRERKTFGIKEKDLLKNLLIYGDKQSKRAKIVKAILAQKLAQKESGILLDFSGEVYDWAKDFAARAIQIFDSEYGTYGIDPLKLKNIPDELISLASEQALKILSTYLDIKDNELLDLLSLAVKTSINTEGANLHMPFMLILDDNLRVSILQKSKNKFILDFWLNNFEDFNQYKKIELKNKVELMHSKIKADKKLMQFISLQRTIDFDEIITQHQAILFDFQKQNTNDKLSGFLAESIIFLQYLSKLKYPEHRTNLFLNALDGFELDTIQNIMSEEQNENISVLVSTDNEKFLEKYSQNFASVAFFRTSNTPAVLWAEQYFKSYFKAHDFSMLDDKSFYLRLLIDSQLSKPFSADTLSDSELMQFVTATMRDKIHLDKKRSKIKLPGANESIEI